jgi:AcrR family transcriptional regulator
MPKVTDEHLAARRRQILSAALACFARNGFHRTTMQDIFKEAELSPGAVYSYFNSKDDLVGAIIAETMGFIAKAASALTEPLPDGRLRRPGEALAEVIEQNQKFEMGTVDQRARIFPHLIGEQQRDPTLNVAARDGLSRLRQGFATLAFAAQERGELSRAVDPDHYGNLAISLLQGIMIQISVFGAELDLDGYVSTAVALLDGDLSSFAHPSR